MRVTLPLVAIEFDLRLVAVEMIIGQPVLRGRFHMRITNLWILAAACAAVLLTGQLSMAQPMGDAPPMSPMQGAASYGCSDGMCGPGYDTCGDCCGWSNRWNIFGEFLYLRPRDAETAYGSIIEGPIVAGAPGLQAGRTGVLDYDYQPGFRVGGGFTLDNCNQIQVSYSQLDATTNDTLTTAAPNVIRGLVLHPNSLNAGANFLDASATGDVRFQMLDAAYRGLIASCSDYEVGYLVGVRYARFEQFFQATYNNVGVETVTSSVDFDGVGMRFGMDFERYGRNRQWFVYGKSYASLVGGRFESAYLQANQADASVAQTTWEAGRVVTMLDLEAGIGWQNCGGNLRLSLGYLYSGWFNTIRNNEWISAVQNNDFVANGMSTYDSGITFDGLTARVELLW
jgi:hypothetical protein